MSAAAAKRTVLAAASLLTLVAVVIVGPAGGAPGGKGDRNPPSAPGNPHVTGATPKQVGLAWEPAQDDVGVAGYYVYGDTGRATVSGTSYVVTTLDCGQSSAVAVSAFDPSGNRSPKVWTTVATAACPDAQPPTTPAGFMQSATTQTGVVLTWSPSADNVGVVGYGVYRSSTRVASPSDPSVTLSGLSCGSTYAYGVDALDAAGNRSPIATTFVQTASCADGQAPTQPSGLAVASRTTDSLSLTWAASSDNVGVAGYRVSLNGSPATTVSQPGAVLGGLSCGTTYTVAVDAFDAAGNRSPASSIPGATDTCPAPPPTADTTPPTTPTGLAVSNVTQSGMTVAWSASTDNVGVTGYDVSRNGTKVASVGGTSAAQTGLSCGASYTYAVVARDAAGNASQAGQIVAATAACSSPPPPADSTPPSQPSGLSLSGATRTSLSLTWGASIDNVGVVGYRIYVNGSAGGTTTQTNTTVSALTCGTAYTLEVDAYDAAGNRSTRATVVGSTAACADSQPPTAPTNLVTTSRTATSIALAWTASSDNTGVAGYGLYRGTTLVGTSGTASGIFSGLTCNTSYSLAVDAYDAAGNRSQRATTMVSTTACPDTLPPSMPTGLAVSNVTQTGLTLSWNPSTDNVGVTGYDVYRGNTLLTTVGTTSAAPAGLGCSTSYTFGVVARDAAGNSSQQATASVQTSACSAPAPPGDKFAAPNGSDSNPGTLAAPFLTLRKLASSLAPGQVGMLRGGTYGDASTYHPVNASGASGQPITITSYPGESVTVKGYLEVNGSFVTIKGLRIDGSNSLLNAPSKCGTQALGILLQGNDIIFERNEVYQSGLKGSAIIQDGDRNVIRFNKLHDFGSCYHYDHGVYIGDGDSVQVYGNWIWNNAHGWGIHIYPGPTNARVYGNVIDANGGGFIISDEGSATSTGNRVYNNVVVNSVGMTTQGGHYIAPAALSGSGPVAGSNNSFTDNAAFNNPVGGAPNVAMSGNFIADPKFVDASGHNYAVSSSSPLVSWGLWNGR